LLFIIYFIFKFNAESSVEDIIDSCIPSIF